MNNNNKTIIQIGSHVGNTINDPIFNIVDDNTTLILVEPIPFLFEQLKNNYKEKFGNNQNIFFINKAVSNFIGEIEMTFPSEKNDFSKLPFWASQLASIDPYHALIHNETLIVEKINVKTTTINEIVKEYSITQIDLLHTDTEGHDFTILMNYNFEIKPKKIMFEHRHMDGFCNVGEKYIELSNRLLSLGYKKIDQDIENTTFQLIEKMDLTHRIKFIKESNLEDLEKLIKKLGSNTEISSEQPKMDLTRIKFIKESNLEDLKNHNYLENLIIKLGFNTEILREQPKIVKDNGGGLLIWQYPNQFSKYLCLLSEQKIQSYIEIGCRWGGTFVLTNEYLKIFNTVNKSVAVDIIDSPVLNYCTLNNKTQFMKINSRSQEFKNYMNNNYFDLIFIDGDHSYNGVKNDYEISKNSGKIFVFHDIVNSVCPGVVNFWNELKNNEKDTYNFFEFIEQYEDVWNNTHQKFLGIGVAIKK